MCLGAFAAHAADAVTGAGASFPAPIYSKWAEAYNKATGNQINYQSVGSGAGIKQIKEKTVDFGASDMPLKDEDLSAAGLMQFPTVIGGVVPVIHVEGVKPGQLKLTGTVLADIYLGKITKWSDPAITALNAGVKLPDAVIAPVHRADGSGTSFIFTNYLSKVSADWKAKIGEGTAVNWPANGLAGKGNEGVAQNVQRLPNSIGYVEYAYAKQSKMDYVSLKNAAGSFVEPDDLTFKAAAAGADWSKSFYQLLTEQPGKDSWPITGATFILMHVAQDKPAQATASLKFFDWAYANGDKAAADLDYVSLPDSLKSLIHTKWAGIKDTAGKSVASK
ncbi:MAG: phosphate ABC transporter substrate-binding protein PstS [Pseudomonadota bacterium]|nr:phosphate ABC transporter substrate-binding protein PstS [Pseudomonadota bacterium]